MKRWKTLQQELDHLERTDKNVAAAARDYEKVKASIVAKSDIKSLAKEIKTLKDKPEVLFSVLVTTTKALRKLEAKNPELIKELRKLENHIEKLEKDLKEACRPLAVSGETVTVVDGAEGSVRVVGALSGPEYSFELAEKYWQSEILEQTAAIDSKKVTALIELGFGSGIAAKAELPRKELTPRVIVRVA